MKLTVNEFEVEVLVKAFPNPKNTDPDDGPEIEILSIIGENGEKWAEGETRDNLTAPTESEIVEAIAEYRDWRNK